jgi:hypothetical protein
MSFEMKIASCGFKFCVVAVSALSAVSAVMANEQAADAESSSEEASGTEKGKRANATQGKGEKSFDWLYHSRVGLGAGRSSAAKNMKTDRLGFGLFAGRALKEMSFPFVDGKDLSAGVAYQSFTGVDVSSDTQWSVQSMGPQMRLHLDPFLSRLELSVLGGVSVQRFVSEKGPRHEEARSYGVALASGAFARWPLPALEGMHVVGGADLLLGKATWFSIGGGLEAEF